MVSMLGRSILGVFQVLKWQGLNSLYVSLVDGFKVSWKEI